MKKSKLRTHKEKILFPIAVLFSAAVWIGLVFAVFSGFSNVNTEDFTPCISLEEDGYHYINMSSAKEKGVTESCMDKADIPEDVFQGVTAKLSEENMKEAGVGIVILIYVGAIMLFIYLTTAISVAHIRMNGMRLSEKQHSKFYKIYEQSAKELGLKKTPNAYVIHAGGELNAFAVKIARKKTIVLFAELIEELADNNRLEELHAVAVHELTHIRLNHVNYWIFLLPFKILPFFGKMLSREREYSADRGAYLICKDKKIVSQAMIKLITGKIMAKEVNMEEYLEHYKSERGFITWLAKVMSTHPPIPERIMAIEKYASKEQ